MMTDRLIFSKLLKKIDRKKQFIHLDKEESYNYLCKMRDCLYRLERSYYNERSTWFDKRELRNISSSVNSLSKLLEMVYHHKTRFNMMDIDKDSGFPSWAGVQELYSLPEDEMLYSESYKKRIIENARYRLLRGMDVEANATGLRNIEFYSKFRSTKLPELREPTLFEENRVTFLDYSIVRNHPIYWSIILAEKEDPEPQSLNDVFKTLILERIHKTPVIKKKSKIHDSFRKWVNVNTCVGAKPMYLLLNSEFSDTIEKIKTLYIGPFYFSPEQDLDDASRVLKFDLRDYLQKHEDRGILVTQYECCYEHTGKLHEKSGIKLYSEYGIEEMKFNL